tara:strand:+ start:149425 stop:149946 length:522 start_codon:yes stop_codon:yes gene_type:complete
MLLITSFLISCSTSINSNHNVDSKNLKGYYAYTYKEIPSKEVFFLPEKYEIISKSNYGNTLNQHYVCITNSELDEIQISSKHLKTKNKTYTQRKIANIFWLELSWLEKANSIFKDSNLEIKNSIIYNIFKKNKEHTILLGIKEGRKIYIELINPSTTYEEELIKVKDLFNKIR